MPPDRLLFTYTVHTSERFEYHMKCTVQNFINNVNRIHLIDQAKSYLSTHNSHELVHRVNFIDFIQLLIKFVHNELH